MQPRDGSTFAGQPGPSAKSVGASALAGGAMLAMIFGLVSGPLKSDEGTKPVGYLDFARGIATDCTGHTGPDVKVGLRKTDAQCNAELRSDVDKHMRGVLACSPELATRPYQLGAMTRGSFNFGVAGYCRSTMRVRFAARDWRGGCDALLAWDKARVGGRIVRVRGLTLRRARERAMCLTGVA